MLRYRRRVSGPLLDRIDMLVDVPALRWEQLADAAPGETSAVVRARVSKARARAARRHGTTNARIPPVRLEEACRVDRGGRSLLRKAVTHLGLTARGYHRALRVSRTIADLEERGRRIRGPRRRGDSFPRTLLTVVRGKKPLTQGLATNC